MRSGMNFVIMTVVIAQWRKLHDFDICGHSPSEKG